MKKLIFLYLLVSSDLLATTYKYDDSNKLQQVTYDNGTVVSYEYDTDGNLTKITPTESSSGGDTGGGTDNGSGDSFGFFIIAMLYPIFIDLNNDFYIACFNYWWNIKF